MPEIVGIEITKGLPAEAVAESTYRIEGNVKILDTIGAPPFVYTKTRYKEWFKPEAAEKVSYSRGWPVPFTGLFTIEFKPEKEGEYEVTVVATPALIALPVLGIIPTLAESDVMRVSVGQRPPAAFRFAEVIVDGNNVYLGDHDADSQLLLQKTTSDYLEVLWSFEWTGPRKTAVISVKAGHKGAIGFSAKTDAYTQTVELPESPDTPYSGSALKAIRIPLTKAGGISDGAIEIVAKIKGESDYITHIWNVYRTEVAVVAFRFSDIRIDGQNIALGNHDADSNLLLQKSTSDYLDIVPAFEWNGPRKTAMVSVKAGYRDFIGGFTPKTGAYTRSIQLPEAIGEPYIGDIGSAIRLPLVSAGGLNDGAIEVVLKLSGEPDYISRIWNVYITKEPGSELAQTLEVDITPTNGGYVTTVPQPESGPSQWVNNSTGQFPYGTRVMVTAHPYSGYEFDHWSDEIEGGVSYVNPEYVAGIMTEHRAVKAHFRQIGEEPPPGGPPAADIRSIDLVVTGDTYKIGDRVPFRVDYEYKGKAQSGQMVLSIGTGVYPSFSTRQTYLPMSVAFDEAMDWVSLSISGSFVLTSSLETGQLYSVRARLETLEDRTQETDTDWGVIRIESIQVGVSFRVGIFGIPDFGSYDYWSCSYWDPGTGAFAGDLKWYHSYDKISFDNVQPGGYLGVFLKKDSSVSGQYNSPTIQPVNGGLYIYDVQSGRVYAG